MLTDKVKWFSAQNGYEFIRPDDGRGWIYWCRDGRFRREIWLPHSYGTVTICPLIWQA